MTTDAVTTRVLEALVRVAPEIDPATVRPDASIRDEYDLDSMDFLNFVIGLHEAFGVDIPEADYPALATVAGCVGYLRAHGAGEPAAAPATARREHRFEAALLWQPGGQGAAERNHTVAFPGRPPLELSAPPEYRGDAARLSPEELFVASLASCQLLSYLALAARHGIAIARYEDRPAGVLAVVDRRMRVREVLLRPRIALVAGTDADAARRLVDRAHDECFVANSTTARVTIEPEIVAG